MPVLQTENQSSSYPSREASARKGPKARWFWLFWIILIGAGVAAAYYYSNHLQQEMITRLQQDTQKEMAALKAQYDSRFSEISSQMNQIDSKVQAFNELLTFTKDQASGKTDNSNKLYSQLNDVKQQLSNLEKKLELLK
ncbi:hypothetical protein [Paenibacillus lemnae]|uniref:Uncharacterized protein n=1 Tax=Paenibacillus lemnae TaxID=1330551 RepID=A0A848M937_PAELE|nr:hypothetical protein [Paenibacillus lemnae]NMO96014.1 hypothetical protein [Paenibacillus lemnae]